MSSHVGYSVFLCTLHSILLHRQKERERDDMNRVNEIPILYYFEVSTRRFQSVLPSYSLVLTRIWKV